MKSIQPYLSNDLYYFCIQEKYQLFLDMKISKKNFNINQIRKLIFSCNLQERFPFKLDFNKEFEYTQLGILILSNDNVFHLSKKEKIHILKSIDFENDNFNTCFQIISHIYIQNFTFYKYEWKYLLNNIKNFQYPQTSEGNLEYYIITDLNSNKNNYKKINDYIYIKDLKKLIYNLNLSYISSDNYLDNFNHNKSNSYLLNNIFSLHEKYQLPIGIKEWKHLLNNSHPKLIEDVNDLPILKEIEYQIFSHNIKKKSKVKKIKHKI